MSDINNKDYQNRNNPIEGASEEEIDKAVESIVEIPKLPVESPIEIKSGSPTNLGEKILSPEAQSLVDDAILSIEDRDKLRKKRDPGLSEFLDNAFAKPKIVSEKAQSAVASSGQETGVLSSEDTDKMNLDDVDELFK